MNAKQEKANLKSSEHVVVKCEKLEVQFRERKRSVASEAPRHRRLAVSVPSVQHLLVGVEGQPADLQHLALALAKCIEQNLEMQRQHQRIARVRKRVGAIRLGRRSDQSVCLEKEGPVVVRIRVHDFGPSGHIEEDFVGQAAQVFQQLGALPDCPAR